MYNLSDTAGSMKQPDPHVKVTAVTLTGEMNIKQTSQKYYTTSPNFHI